MKNNSVKEIITKITKKDILEKCCFFMFGIFLAALSFNLFFSPNNIVTGGSAGLSIIFNYLYNIDESKFVLYISLGLLIVSFFLLGKEATLKNTIGTILYPLFIKLTSYLVVYFNIETDSLLLVSLYGGIILGIATSIMMKTGFTTGGFNILYQIFNKYFKISIGNANLIINSIILILSIFVFGLPRSIYAIIALFITSFVADKFILGISQSKTFYIVTDKEDEVKEYILNHLKHGVTILNVKGGVYNKKKNLILCVVPTKEYYRLKEVVLEIDKDAFFLITDSYETGGAI